MLTVEQMMEAAAASAGHAEVISLTTVSDASGSSVFNGSITSPFVSPNTPGRKRGTTDEDPGHRDDDCRERCDFNADCPSGQPLCVYGRCFAEGDVPFEP